MSGIGIIGFGRVGRGLMRELCSRGQGGAVRLVAEADAHGRGKEKLARDYAYLLSFDTSSGPFPAPVAARGGELMVGDNTVALDFSGNPSGIDWRGAGVDVLIEASGDDRVSAQAAALAPATVDRVLITRGERNAQVALVRGVNFGDYEPKRHQVISCSTCTANAAAPVLKVLHETYGIEQASLTTVHPALSGDTLLDTTAGRSGLTIRPVTSEMASSIAQVLPQLEGRLLAMSLRAPTLVVNALMADVVLSTPPGQAGEVKALLTRAAQGPLAGIMRLDEGFAGRAKVAADFQAEPCSAVVDANWLALTGPLLRMLIWHDNEYAYCRRVVDVLELVTG